MAGSQAESMDLTGRVGEAPSEFYLTLLQEFPALIWRSDTEGRCDWFNSTWLQFTGRTLEQETGDGWTEGVHPDDLKTCVKTWRKSFAAQTPFVMEYRLRRNDCEYRWIRDFGRPFFSPDGDFLGYIGACYDITDLREMADELAHLASHDPLTRLPNRRAFQHAVARARSAARRGRPSMVMFADLDRFKQCNDRYGHRKGDQVLQEIAQAMSQAVREIDMVARIGGDEFAILLRGDDGSAVEEVQYRLADAVARVGSAHMLDIGLSMGAALVDGERTTSEVLAEADRKMYEAKKKHSEAV